ncbi:MAG: hypothetical protein ACLFTI_08250, partial [Anaerolineales bacterium]
NHNNIPNFTDFYLNFWDFPIAIVGKLRYNVVGCGEEWGKVGKHPSFCGERPKAEWIFSLRGDEYLCF